MRASYDEIPKATQDEVFAGAKAFVKANKGRYECGGYIYSGEGQELGQFWANLNVGNATLQINFEKLNQGIGYFWCISYFQSGCFTNFNL